MEELEKEQEIITLEDEEGGCVEMAVLDRLTMNDQEYIVIHDLADEEDPDSVMIYRLNRDEDGNEFFDPIEDEDELEDVFDLFRVSW